MSKNKGHIKSELFKKHLLNTLDANEKLDFEKDLSEDAFEKEAFEGFESLANNQQALDAIEAIEVKIAQKTGITKERKFQFVYWKQVGIAASFLLLLGAAFGIKEQLKSNEQVALNVEKVVAEEDVLNSQAYTDSNFIFGFEDTSFQEFVRTTTPMVLEDKEKGVKDILKQDLVKEAQKPASDLIYVPTENESFSKEEAEDLSVSQNITSTNVGTSKELITIDKKKPEVSTASSPGMASESSSNTVNIKFDFNDGKEKYSEGDFAAAITYFESSINNGSNVMESEYYIGMSNYNLSKSNKALKSFEKVIASSSPLRINAQWYKSLILLDKGQIPEAKLILKELANGSSSFKNQAIDKLKSLN